MRVNCLGLVHVKLLCTPCCEPIGSLMRWHSEVRRLQIFLSAQGPERAAFPCAGVPGAGCVSSLNLSLSKMQWHKTTKKAIRLMKRTCALCKTHYVLIVFIVFERCSNLAEFHWWPGVGTDKMESDSGR